MTRIAGPLNIGALRRCFSAIVARHDALRTRIAIYDGVPVQEVEDQRDLTDLVKLEDWSLISEDKQRSEISRLLEAPDVVDVTRDPLFTVRLARLSPEQHILITMMEHIVSDGLSISILLDELLTGYRQIAHGLDISLPAIPLQFSEYALLQRASTAAWLRENGQYLTEHFAGCDRVRFPDDRRSAAESEGWGVAPFKISNRIKSELAAWCRSRKTTLVMGTLTAYVSLLLRWCSTRDTVVLFQSDGRSSRDVGNAIGYFAFPLYLRIQLCKNHTLLDVLHAVMQEYCAAYDHADFSYMESLSTRPGFTRNSCFNWLRQQEVTEHQGLAPKQGGSTEPVLFIREALETTLLKHISRDTEPMMGFIEGPHDITGGIYFPRNRFSVASMERFARNFFVFLAALREEPWKRAADIALVD